MIPIIGPIRQQAPYPQFLGVTTGFRSLAGAPRLGEHTDEVFSTLLGLVGKSEIAALREHNRDLNMMSTLSHANNELGRKASLKLRIP